MLPRPYAPIIPLGRGPCGRVSKAEREEGGEWGEKKKEGVMEGGERRKVAEVLF